MTAILWILIIIAFALAFIGLIKPVIPSLLMLWIGFLIYQFGFHDGRLSWIFYVAMTIFTIMILVADFVMNKYIVNRFGGSKIGEYKALIGVIVGCFVFPPFGFIIIPFVAVFFVDVFQGFNFNQLKKVSFG
ncbi:DUF456 domain-containing protein [Limosilactobacillus reuteri]|uniref:DUF456 domain-containing protein n=1 Tax=Limosilactobacillus reuteri TaxID=1598 RepID=UPI000A57823B|nr:DUF456 family protein [Limosilactobacillus reuteri]